MRGGLALVLTGFLLLGCGADERTEMPTACRDATAEQVQKALEDAPGEVRISGTPLSDCFNRNASTGDVQGVGAVFIDVAENLADEARQTQSDEAATRLGYLIGASERGSGRTQGIHTELIRRLRNTSAGLESNSSYARGVSAGRRNG